MNRFVVAFLAASGVLALLFFYVPQIDLWMAGLFYTPGEGFVLQGSRAVDWLRRLMAWSTQLFVIAGLALLVANVVRQRLLKKATPLLASSRSVVYVLLALGLGPGLLVNGILKSHSGRARPNQVMPFGGNKQFTQAFALSDQCAANCSFVSGESAVGFFGLTFVFIAQRRRTAIAVASILLGLLLGFIRMGQGAHFFSDVIFSGVFTFLVSYLLYVWIFDDDKNEHSTDIIGGGRQSSA